MSYSTIHANHEEYVDTLQSIKQTTECLLNATIEELNAVTFSSSSSFQKYSSNLLKCVRKLSQILILCSNTATQDGYDFCISVANYDPDADGIQLWVEDDCVTIRLPSLPHRYKGNQDMIAQLLAAKIHLCPQFPQWRIWHAEFIHLYPKKYKSIPRDVDNYNYKKVIDVIAYGLHTSDDAEHFDMAMTTVYSDDYELGVYVQITPTTLENRPLPSPIARKDRK